MSALHKQLEERANRFRRLIDTGVIPDTPAIRHVADFLDQDVVDARAEREYRRTLVVEGRSATKEGATP